MQVAVKRSVHLAADAASVWQRIGDFGTLDAWHPVVAACAIERSGGETFRKLTTVDGAALREQLIAASDADMTCSYSIVESPLPVADYRSTLSVAGSGCVVVWTSTFNASGASGSEAAAVIAGIYEAGLSALG